MAAIRKTLVSKTAIEDALKTCNLSSTQTIYAYLLDRYVVDLDLLAEVSRDASKSACPLPSSKQTAAAPGGA
ncbi:hypothetical protein [Roseibium sp. RKSG952]|uniref:hypothetical protein n=1 Tax=Roseibium sp. RKSG952 TaxID=2529384 RepID=UPI0012BC76BC|nr:hypothetical protein [Roseibium sp. RKSG952]MTI00199.1 hypothetical protein [Roseibium sp. RKSG952]